MARVAGRNFRMKHSKSTVPEGSPLNNKKNLDEILEVAYMLVKGQNPIS